ARLGVDRVREQVRPALRALLNVRLSGTDARRVRRNVPGAGGPPGSIADSDWKSGTPTPDARQIPPPHDLIGPTRHTATERFPTPDGQTIHPVGIKIVPYVEIGEGTLYVRGKAGRKDADVITVFAFQCRAVIDRLREDVIRVELHVSLAAADAD